MNYKRSIRTFFLKINIAFIILMLSSTIIINSIFILTNIFQSRLPKIIYPILYQLHLTRDHVEQNFNTLIIWSKKPSTTLEKKIINYFQNTVVSDIQKLKSLTKNDSTTEYKNLYQKLKQLSWEEYKIISTANHSKIYANQFASHKKITLYSKRIKNNIKYALSTTSKQNINLLMELYDQIEYLDDYLSLSSIDSLVTYIPQSQSVSMKINNFQKGYELASEKGILPKNEVLISKYVNLQKQIITAKPKLNYIDNELIEKLNPIKNDISQILSKLILLHNAKVNHTIKLVSYYLFIGIIVSLTFIILFLLLSRYYYLSLKYKIITPIEKLVSSMRGISENNTQTLENKKNLLYDLKELYITYTNMINRRIRYEQELKNQSDKLGYIATHDSLTGLHNYEYFQKKFSEVESKTDFNIFKFMISFILLNNLEQVSSILGKEEASNAIKKFSNELHVLAENNIVTARLSDNSFVLFSKSKKEDDDFAFIELINKDIEDALENTNLYPLIQHSTVVIVYPKFNYKLDELIRHCQFSAHNLIQVDSSKILLYSEMTQIAFDKTRNLELSLKNAIKNNEIKILYQPQYCLSSDQIIGCEVLARWEQPNLGFINTEEFISIAEKTGLIYEIGQFIQETSFRDYANWIKETNVNIKLSLNASLIELLNDKYLDNLLNKIKKHNIDQHLIEIELTETILSISSKRLKSVITSLKENHIKIALDDFGTGYSSLSKLKNYRFNLIKIDKSFVDNIVTNEQDASMLSGIIKLIKNMKMDVIVEGVESKDQIERLKIMGCSYIQGFYYSKPITAEQMLALLRTIKTGK